MKDFVSEQWLEIPQKRVYIDAKTKLISLHNCIIFHIIYFSFISYFHPVGWNLRFRLKFRLNFSLYIYIVYIISGLYTNLYSYIYIVLFFLTDLNREINVSVNSNNSFSLSWNRTITQKYHCYSIEWWTTGEKLITEFFRTAKNFYTVQSNNGNSFICIFLKISVSLI